MFRFGFLLLIVLFVITQFQIGPAQAKTIIAILDSGVDYKNPKLASHIWENTAEQLNSKDDDKNGYIDDIRGWNFIKGSSEIFDFSLYGTFSSDVYKYSRLRAKKTLETATAEELAWLKKKKKDKKLKEERSKFRSYIHGTHIGGIALHANPKPTYAKLELLVVGYLGKAEKGIAKEPDFIPLLKGSNTKKLDHLRHYLITIYGDWQIKKLKTAIEYASPHAKVINGSFGKSFGGSKKIITESYQKQFGELTSDQLKEPALNKKLDSLTTAFLSNLVSKTERLIKSFPKIVFVFSAGNKKEDTDKQLHYPSNARTNNSLSIGASKYFFDRAYFSNFGRKTVDLMAPGFAIKSTIPEERKLTTNGTSQASPFVANLLGIGFEVASRIKLKLTATQAKKLMMATVDFKRSLNEKTVSGGIVNPKRFLKGIELLKKHSLVESIKLAKRAIKDREVDNTTLEEKVDQELDARVLPSSF